MLHKLQVRNVSEAGECPFYVLNGEGNPTCFIKHSVPVHIAMAMVDTNPDFQPALWNTDCGGTYARCGVIPLLWDMKEAGAQPAQVLGDPQIESYNPFADDEPEDEPEPAAPARVAESPLVVEAVVAPEPAPAPEPHVSVSIHKLDNPYLAKADVLVYPTNSLLEIDDVLLDTLSRGSVRRELEQYQRPVSMGSVIRTSSGKVPNNPIKAKSIYHAVVAGLSRLVNEGDIKSAIRRALLMAEDEGARQVVMIPADCGTHDIHMTAMVQLSAIKTFLNTVQTKSIENIFIVMDDDDSLAAFEEYFDRIFAEQ